MVLQVVRLATRLHPDKRIEQVVVSIGSQQSPHADCPVSCFLEQPWSVMNCAPVQPLATNGLGLIQVGV